MGSPIHNFASADTAPWHERTQARVIFASCIASPPLRKRISNVYAMTTDEYTAFDRDDKRVEALDILHNQAFLEAEALGGPHAKAAALCITVDQMLDALVDASRIAPSWGGWRE